MPPTPKRKPQAAAAVDVDPKNRPVVHDHLRAFVAAGADRLMATQAKELLGWTEDEEVAKAAGFSDPLLTDLYDRKVWCLNNARNRPFTESWAKMIAQDILNRRFAPKGPNGEAVIIGRTGLVLSAQHRLVGLALAEQARCGPDKHHWVEKWPEDGPNSGECYVETFISYGVDESPETVQTLDNVRPRSLADVLYIDEDVSSKTSGSDRNKLSKIIDFGIRLLWARTGVGHGANNAFSPRRTHSEALDFVHRHMRLVAAAKHVYQEDKEGSISKKIGLGYAAALLYLMGASNTDPEAYHCPDGYNEEKVSWKNWNKAVDFWTTFSRMGTKPQDVPEFKALRFARRPLMGQSKDEPWQGYVFTGDRDSGALSEKIAVIVKAWCLFLSGETLTDKRLSLNYACEWSDPDMENDGLITLVAFRMTECPDVGGIDIGEPEEAQPEPTPEGEAEPTEGEDGYTPSQEELEAGMQAAQRARETKDKKPAPTVAANMAMEIKVIQDAHPDRILLFKSGGASDDYIVWGEQTSKVTEHLTLPKPAIKRDPKVQLMRTNIPAGLFVEAVAKLKAKGLKLGVVPADGKSVDTSITDAVSDTEPAAPSANGKTKKPGKAKEKAKLRGGTGK